MPCFSQNIRLPYEHAHDHNFKLWNKKVACSTMLKHQDCSIKSYPYSHTINMIGLITASGASESSQRPQLSSE